MFTTFILTNKVRSVYPTSISKGIIIAAFTTLTRKLSITGMLYIAYNHVGVNNKDTTTSILSTESVQKAIGTGLCLCLSEATCIKIISPVISARMIILSVIFMVVVISSTLDSNTISLVFHVYINDPIINRPSIIKTNRCNPLLSILLTAKNKYAGIKPIKTLFNIKPKNGNPVGVIINPRISCTIPEINAQDGPRITPIIIKGN